MTGLALSHALLNCQFICQLGKARTERDPAPWGLQCRLVLRAASLARRSGAIAIRPNRLYAPRISEIDRRGEYWILRLGCDLLENHRFLTKTDSRNADRSAIC